MSTARRERWENLTFGQDDRESRKRLRELILFIAERCLNDPTFGAVKLNKILFFADFISFARYGEPITGTSYGKLPLGPVPTAARAVRAEMEAADEIFMVMEGYNPSPRHRLIARREADLGGFKPRDIVLIDGIIETLHGVSGSAVSEVSHDRAWESVEDYEMIPYEAAYISGEPLTERDLTVAFEMVAEYEEYEREQDR
jgi:hypothetical protein